MTQEQANHISKMRKRGLTFLAIADQLALPISTVKSFCQRNSVNPEAQVRHSKLVGAPECAHCGRLLEVVPKRKPRRFCSDACRIAWWRAHPDMSVTGTASTRVCRACGREFICFRSQHKIYCSRACYQDMRRGKMDAITGST